jgi:uncharacterized membrane protein YfcA
LTTSISSTLIFRKARIVDWAMALVLEASTALSGFIGGLYSGHLSGKILTYVFAGVLIFAAFFIVRGIRLDPKRFEEAQRFYMWSRRTGSETYCVNMAFAPSASFLAGALSGLIGIGGGILLLPMMVLLFGMPMNIAVGSSAFMVGVTAIGGFLGQLTTGHFDWRVTLALTPGIFLAAQLGARHSIKADNRKMKVFFGYLLFALSVLVVIRTSLK